MSYNLHYAGPYRKKKPSLPRVCAVLTVNGRIPSLPTTHIGGEKFSGTRQLD